MCAHHPNIELLGVSTVHGNASLERTTRNASSILVALNRADVPLYPGATKPFSRQAMHAPDIHGETGLDGTSLLPPPVPALGSRPNAVPAVTAMYTALKACAPGDAWLVATGTLTNVALLLAVHPDIGPHLAGVSIMGGAFADSLSSLDSATGSLRPRIGNTTPWAEFNVYCDPEAAQAVLAHPDLAGKTILVPLDLTHQVLATLPVQRTVLTGNGSNSSNTTSDTTPPTAKSPLRQMYFDLLMFFADTYANVFGVTAGPPLHDPVAVAAVLHRERVHKDLDFEYDWLRRGEQAPVPVKVLTHGDHGDGSKLGATVVADGSEPNGATGLVWIPRTLNVDRFWESLYACLAQAEFFSDMGKS